MEERADCERRSPVGLFFGTHLPIRGNRGRGGHLRGWDKRDGSAERARLAGVGGERTRKRDPKNAAELLGGPHRMGTPIPIAAAIHPLPCYRATGHPKTHATPYYL